MTETELDRLERDVEQARGRVADNVARLRRPAVVSEFKQDVMSRAVRAKDDLIHRTTDAASSTAQRILADIKSRAAANPAAALAIGAGLAWRLARHPPISTILVGLGVVSLLKTSPTSDPSPVVARAADLASSTTDLAGTVTADAHERAAQARRSAGEALGEFQATASIGASRAREATAAASSKAAAGASDILARASDPDERDDYLLGAAALAIGAAAVIGYRRRED
jgi:hypothetical protein